MKRIFLTLTIFVFSFSLLAQNKGFSADYLIYEFTGYNFFAGPDAQSFITTPKSFGSGVFDFSGQYSLLNFWILKPQKRNIGLATAIAYKLNKFRFKDNLIFDTDNDLIYKDVDPDRYYNQMFLSRQGSKLITGKLHIPLIIYFPVSQWFGDQKGFFGIYGGAYYDGFLYAKHKLYYEENNQLVKSVVKNNKIKNYFTKNTFGVKAGIKLGGFFFFGQYSLTPFFSDILSYEVNEAKIGMHIKIDFYKLIEKKLNIDLDRNDGKGTDAQ
ncbi:MAG: hypothetical protein JXR68_08755 [Bacteroidales bacterium]|nr:hypothetical protein [Bacteroidales bacterium]